MPACPISVPLPFRLPTMPPPWALTSLTRLRPGILARTLWRQSHTSTPHTLPRRYSTASLEAHPESNSRVLADPERPDLFYHLLELPSAVSATNHVFGLSFLNTLKSRDDVWSPRIVGYLPASEGGYAIEAGLNDFRENRESTADLLGHAPMVPFGSWVQGNSAQSNTRRVGGRSGRSSSEWSTPASGRVDAHPRCVSVQRFPHPS